MKNSLHQTNRKWDLFISYSRADNTNFRVTLGNQEMGIVDAFVKRLQESHIEFSGNPLGIFYDKNSIKDDDYWLNTLREGVRDSALFLAFLSPNYINSTYCIQEWKEYIRFQYANARGQNGIKQIYIVTIDELDARQDPDPEHQQYDFLQYMRAIQRNTSTDIRDLTQDPEALNKALQILETQERLEDLIEPEIPKKFDFKSLDTDITTRLDGVFLAEIAEKYSRWPSVLKTFVGRTKEIRDLHEVATQSEIGVVGSVHGLGGQGKTALVSQYAHAFSGFYATGGRWLINCEGYTNLAQAFDQLPIMLNYKLEKEQEALDDVNRIATHLNYMHTSMLQRSENIKQDWLKQRGEQKTLPNLEKRALIVLDNVDHPGLLDASILKDISGIGSWLSIISTTRLDVSELGASTLTKTVIIDDLPLEDRLALLRAYRNIPMREEELALNLVKLSGGVTLLVEILAATIKAEEKLYKRRTLKETLENKIEKIKNSGVFVIDDMSKKIENEIRAQKRQLKLAYIIEDTLESLINPIGSKPAVATKSIVILQYASLFPPEFVIEEWLYNLLLAETSVLNVTSSDDISPFNRDEFEETLSILEGRRLITRNSNKPYTFSIHRDIRYYFRNELITNLKTQKIDLGLFIKLYEAKLIIFLDNYKTDKAQRDWLPYILDFSLYILEDETLEKILTDKAKFNLITLSNVEEEFGSFSKAIYLVEKLYDRLSRQEKVYDDDLLYDIANCEQKLADFYQNRRELEDIEKSFGLYSKCLKKRELLQEKHPKQIYYLRALSIIQERIGIAILRNRLTNDDDRGLNYLKKALKNRKYILSLNPKSSEALQDLSIILTYLGDKYKTRIKKADINIAKSYYEEALDIRKELLNNDPENPEKIERFCVIQHKLAEVYWQEANTEYKKDTVKKIYEDIFMLNEKLLSAAPDSIRAIRFKSHILDYFGDYHFNKNTKEDDKIAESKYKESLTLKEGILKNNPNSYEFINDVRRSQLNLMKFCFEQKTENYFIQAENFIGQATESGERLLTKNPESIELLSDLSHYYLCYIDLYIEWNISKYKIKIIDLYQKGQSCCKKILEKDKNSLFGYRNICLFQKRIADQYFDIHSSSNLKEALSFFKNFIDNLENYAEIGKDTSFIFDAVNSYRLIGDIEIEIGEKNYQKRALKHYSACKNILYYILKKNQHEEINQFIQKIEEKIKNLS